MNREAIAVTTEPFDFVRILKFGFVLGKNNTHKV